MSVEPRVERAVKTSFAHKTKAVFTEMLQNISHECETNFHFHVTGKRLHDASSL